MSWKVRVDVGARGFVELGASQTHTNSLRFRRGSLFSKVSRGALHHHQPQRRGVRLLQVPVPRKGKWHLLSCPSRACHTARLLTRNGASPMRVGLWLPRPQCSALGAPLPDHVGTHTHTSSFFFALSLGRLTRQVNSGNISEKPMRYEAHHAPHSSQAMKYYLDEDPSNIVAVHCLAGKLHSLVCHKLARRSRAGLEC